MTLAWLSLGGALLSTAFAQVAYKRYFLNRHRPLLVGAIILFASAAMFAFLALKGLSIGKVYMSTAVTHVLVVGLSRWLLQEPLTRDHGIATAFIAAGVVLYAW